MSMKYVAVSTITESGDSDVFCIDFYKPEDVVVSVEDMMDEEFAWVTEFKVHCSWGQDTEIEILKALNKARDKAKEQQT